jgi:hypothetical protein
MTYSILAFWLLAGLVARVDGLLHIVVGPANPALDPGTEAVLLVEVGAAIWLSTSVVLRAAPPCRST